MKKENVKFIYIYMRNHKYIGKNTLAGLCVSHFYPHKPNNYKNIQKVFKREISEFFTILKKFDIVSDFNTTTIRVNESFNNFRLDDIFELTQKNQLNIEIIKKIIR